MIAPMEGSNRPAFLSREEGSLDQVRDRHALLTQTERLSLLLVIALAMLGLATRLWHIHADHNEAADPASIGALNEQ